MVRGRSDPRCLASPDAAQLPELRGEHLGSEGSRRADPEGRAAMAEPLIDLRIFDSGSELARAAAEEFTRRAEESVRARGRFAVALSGGSTPRRLFALLADPSQPFRDRIDWRAVHLFWGDE